jgi:NADH-quinone oxidoreductase subunit I
MLRCIYCGYCEDACPTEAIQLGKTYEMSYTNKRDSIYTREMLLDPPVEGAESTPQKVEPGSFDRSIPDMKDPK